jgi:hypothetical protein
MDSSNRCVLYTRTVSSRGSSGAAAPALPAAERIIAVIAKIVIAYLAMVIPPSKK